MEGTPEISDEVPKIRLDEYISRLEVLDAHADVHRNKGFEPITEEFYGELEGWEETTDRFVHDIVTTRIGVKQYTRAACEGQYDGPDPKKYLNSPDAVDHYELWVCCGKDVVKIYLNTRDRRLVREIHDAFFSTLMERESLQEAADWLARSSRYAQQKSPQDASAPLIDFMPKSARKKARETL